ncbi:homing endonuclease associated repeat-containing protein [Natronococcus roseus]|uniref:homing endonuclease associated repeat-containing protein n=1 Tax=Natronococcus roseus TaxID=1052014 RepID=UPI00374CFBA8
MVRKDKDHQCPTCGDQFSSNWGMRSHHKQVHGENVISNEDILEWIRDTAEELERTPTQTEVEEHVEQFNVGMCYNRFESWNEALQKAGFELNLARNPTREDLLSEIEIVRKKIGRVPTTEEMDNHGRYSSTTYWKAFGEWSNALAVLGLSPPHEPTKPDLLSEVQRLHEEIDRVPTKRDMLSDGKYSSQVYSNRFGSWNKAIKSAGFKPNLARGEVTYTPLDYGSGWNEEKKEQVRERDDRICQNPGCGRTEEEHIEEFGMKQPVHHITPADQINNPEERNDPDNLITLCCDGCHQKWEGIPLRPDNRP